MPHQTLKLCGLTVTFAAILVLLNQSIAADSSGDEDLVVLTNLGPIQGTISEYSQEVQTYKGIPFASPPVGELRWLPPQPASAWSEVRDATTFGPECMQPPSNTGFYANENPLPISEDCLYLNVWTKTTDSEAKQPVMVWIHGGAFIFGAGSNAYYEGTRLAEQGITLVTVNYRLGIYGFFAHPTLTAQSENSASGNQGIHDQIASLRWVQNNIQAFGGDPDNVTIFGESAGSMSVCYLVASPLAKGLFQKAIGQSGGCFSYHSTLGDAGDLGDPLSEDLSGHDVGLMVGEALGHAGDSAEALNALRKMSTEEIDKKIAESGNTIPWRLISVDGWMFPDQMRTLMLDGRASTVDSIIGSTKDEGTTLFMELPELPREDWEAQVRATSPAHAEDLLTAYSADADISTVKAQQEMMSDAMFTSEMRTWAELIEQQGKQAWVYVFNHAPPLPEYGRQLGAFHAAEIPYIFQAPSGEGTIGSQELWDQTDRTTARVIQNYWVNFAKHDNPNGEGVPEWPNYSTDSRLTLGIDSESKPIANFRKEKLDIRAQMALEAFPE